MRYLFLAIPFLAITIESTPFYENEALIREGKAVSVAVPNSPLTYDSVAIIPNTEVLDFVNWTPEMLQESYGLIHYVADIWAKRGIYDYLILGKADEVEKSPFFFEMIPYESSYFPFIRHFKVIWNLLFGVSPISTSEKKERVLDFLKNTPSLPKETSNLEKSPDPFLDPQIIERQWVIMGNHDIVLYNYAPIPLGKRDLHFLIIPKERRLGTVDLTEEEFIESEQLSQKLISFYRSKGYQIAYLFSKTGSKAGQTVLHWHQHLLFAESEETEFNGKLSVIKNMIFGSSVLSSLELEKRVTFLRDELRELK
jgi:diadenosine tetraphosphate (Ap4A) HIT family hydrolase